MLYVHINRRLSGDGSPGRPPRLSHSSRAQSAGDDDDDDDDDDEVELHVLGCCLTYEGQIVTNAEARSSVAFRPQKP